MLVVGNFVFVWIAVEELSGALLLPESVLTDVAVEASFEARDAIPVIVEDFLLEVIE